jgi:hypothetical protein
MLREDDKVRKLAIAYYGIIGSWTIYTEAVMTRSLRSGLQRAWLEIATASGGIRTMAGDEVGR